jgi:hypothetical protein
VEPRPRRRYWFELVLAGISSILFVVTLFWKDWIEIIFGVDPDEGSGALEWLIVGAFFVIAVVSSVLARREWHRAEIASG